MLSRMLHAPINLFFDLTPSGLIHKRFTSDLDVMSRHLPGTIKWNMRNIIVIIMTLSFVSFNAPLCLLFVPVALFLYSLVLKGFTKANSEFGKLGSCSGGPTASHLSESIEGAATIRTFKKIHEFEDRRSFLNDQQYSVEILERGLNSWL